MSNLLSNMIPGRNVAGGPNEGGITYLLGDGKGIGNIRFRTVFNDGEPTVILERATLNVIILENQDWVELSKQTPDQFQVEALIRAGLNSFALGSMWRISSGGHSVFFSNSIEGIDYSPAWGGLRDQSITEYQDATGVHVPDVRTYTDNMTEAEPYGIAHATDTLEYAVSLTIGFNISAYGVEIELGEALFDGDILTYQIRDIDENGILGYTQQIIVMGNKVVGDPLIIWFTQPYEAHSGTTGFITLKHGRVGDNGALVLVKQSAINATEPYRRVWQRVFTDSKLQLATFVDVIDGLLARPGTDYRGMPTEDTILNMLGPVSATSAPGDSFRVFDGDSALSNSTKVVITFDTGQISELRKKNDNFTFTWDGTVWRFLDNITGDAGTV